VIGRLTTLISASEALLDNRFLKFLRVFLHWTSINHGIVHIVRLKAIPVTGHGSL
jgi:hypothetical protein